MQTWRGLREWTGVKTMTATLGMVSARFSQASASGFLSRILHVSLRSYMSGSGPGILMAAGYLTGQWVACRRVRLLVLGDAAALLAFAMVGRINHGELLDAETFATVLPFWLGAALSFACWLWAQYGPWHFI